MHQKLISSLFFALIFSTPVMAENAQSVNLSLQDCIEMALKNNLDLQIERINPESKGLDLRRIYESFGLTFGFRPSLQNNIRPTSNSFISGGSVLNEFGQNYNFYLSQRLPSNGEVSVQFNNNISSTNSTRVDLNPAIIPGLSLNVQQPILRNSMNGYRLISIGKNETITSNLRLKSKAIEVITRTQDAYWTLVLNKERLKVLENSLKLNKELLKINQAKEKAGFLAKIDLLTTQASIASKEEGLLQGRKFLIQSENELKRLLNPNISKIGWNVSVITNDLPKINKVPVQFEESYEKSLKNRPDYKAALVDKNSLNIQTEINNQNRFPELNFNGSVGLNSLDSNYFNAVGKLFNFSTYSWSLGLNVEIPVIGNTYEVDYQQGLLNQNKQKLIIENIELQIGNEVKNSIQEVEINEKRIEANQTSKNLATEQVKAETEKLNLGLSTNFQLLQFQRDLEDANLNEVNARIDYIKSLNNLSQVEGTTLEKNNIIWDDSDVK